MKATRVVALFVIVFGVTGSLVTPGARMQSERTLVGEWLVTSSPINGQLSSPRGNTRGFPDRDMFFEQDGSIRTGVVVREDAGAGVKPLGVWRIDGDQFSTTFQLWCPDSNGTCGSIVMRGEFVRDDRIRGTMTAFFDVPDESNPAGFDTWTFSFRGDLVQTGATSAAAGAK